MNKKLLKSTFILLSGGFLTKLLGMLIRIMMSRNIGIEGLSLYSLILPTFSLCITLGQIGLPITLSRLVALNNKNNKNLYYSILPITFLINILLMILILILSNYIGNTLLHSKEASDIIKAIAFVIPFTTLSSICRSYFFGKERMFPHVLSNIMENIIRLMIIMIVIPKLNYLNTKDLVFFIVISNIISEGISTIILYLFLPNKINIKNISYEKKLLKETFQLSIPNISGSIIGNISYFLEPILITTILTNIGLSTDYIIREYGIINSYILPFLMIPSFFSIAISQAILPYLSRLYQERNYKKIKQQLTKIMFFLSVFGVIMTIILEIKGDFLLKLLYKNSLGYNYLKILSPIFILYYLEHPLVFTIQAMGKTKDLFRLSILNLITKITCYLLLSILFPNILMYIGTIIVNIIITIFYLVFTIRQKLRQ